MMSAALFFLNLNLFEEIRIKSARVVWTYCIFFNCRLFLLMPINGVRKIERCHTQSSEHQLSGEERDRREEIDQK
jgi:hypothetical protein